MPLKTTGTIAIPSAAGSEFDHAAFDAKSRRVFIAHTARDCVEVICTWTKVNLQSPRMNSVYGPLPPGSRQSLTYLPPIWRNQTNSSRQAGSVIPTNPNFAEMTSPMGLRLSSFAATKRR